MPRLLCTALVLTCLLPAVVRGDDYPVLRALHPFPYSRFFVPNNEEPRTSVIMLHGSEGGSVPYLESEASILASQGFAVLVLCYFDCGRGLAGVRQTLREVDVSIVPRAAEFLRSQPLSNGKVAVYGFSRGAELALISGSLEQERPTALIAHSPSDTYNSYFNWSWRDEACFLCPSGQPDCPRGTPRWALVWNTRCGPDDENRMDFSRSAWLAGGHAVPTGTRIPVETFNGPILITVGEQDDVWPVDQTRRIETTLRSAGREPEIHYFPNAGHVFGYLDENRRRQLVLDFLRRLHRSETP